MTPHSPTPIDLFAIKVEAAHLHPNFLHVATKATAEDRAVLNAWADGFEDRDGKLATEFQTSFNSVFWELYLFAVLKELGHRVDFGHARPDFVVDTADGPFTMEATIASHAAGQPPEWEGTAKAFMDLDDRAPLVQEATIRLSNSLVTKYRKYCEEYSTLPAVRNRPFVLAIAPFEQPYGRVQNTEAIFQTLYAGTATPYEIVGEAEDGTPLVTGGEFFSKKSVRKRSGADILLGLFRGRRMPEVSAVAFSSVATWGKVRALSKDPNPNVLFETLRSNGYGPLPTHTIVPRAEYEEHLLDGLCLFHNPDARHPLNWRTFRGPKVTQVIWGEKWASPEVESDDGVLLQRTVLTLGGPAKQGDPRHSERPNQ